MLKGDTLSKTTQSTGAAAAPAPAKERTQRANRENRITQLREQYLAGSYQVDSAEIARKVVDAHLTR
jgi:anti-sigma28 factor (negative regulator of flagellin synthesis)